MTESMWDDADLDGLEAGLTITNRWTRAQKWAALVVAGAVIWVLFAWIVVPSTINSAYRSESFSFINRVLDHKSEHTVDFYHNKWQKIAWTLLACWLAFGAGTLVYTRDWFAEKVIGKVTPGTLGAIRMLVCVILAYAAFDEPVVTTVSLPLSHRHSLGVMDIFYRLGYGLVLTNHATASVFQTLTILVLLLGAIGFRTRTMLILGAAMYLPLAGTFRSYTWFNHCGIVPWYCLIVLIFTRCADGFSLDRLIRLWRNQPVVQSDKPTRYYAWCRFAVWTVIVMPYVLAGMSKLGNSSFMWWKGENLQWICYTDALRPGLSDHNLIFNWAWLTTGVFTFFGIVTIVQELGMFLVLFSKKLRMILPICVALMHEGIDVLMQIHFWDLAWIQLVFYDFSGLRKWIGTKLAARSGKIEVLYDGACPLCSGCVRVLGAVDLFNRLQMVDFRKTDFATFNAAHETSLSPQMIEKEMFAVQHRAAHGGYYAWRKIAGAVPLLWLAAVLMWLPAVTQVGRWVYQKIADSRFSLLKCDDACPLPLPAAPPATGFRSHSLRWALACGIMPVAFLGLWAKRVEWFPLTSMQMFSLSPYNDSGLATYYQIYMTDAAGRTKVAYLELMGFGTDRYVAVLMDAFKTNPGRQKCEEMMQQCSATWNRTASPEDRIVRMEAQKRQWDFLHHREDPQRGSAVETVSVDIPAEVGPHDEPPKAVR